jgi:serine-type D-Ala-D-Ala carboxypeptidase (penicillin-binding protein 5/6)
MEIIGMLRQVAYVLVGGLFLGTAHAATFETPATQAILIDAATRTVLFEKNSQERMPTSSMSKVMTMYMVFDAIKNGRLKLDDQVVISERAWRMQGSKMFVDVGKPVKVEDLVRGVIIQSGNDAAVALAEAVGGSEEQFAVMMNDQAKKLGMTNSHFMNASGWPDPEHYSTAYDLSLLTYRLINDFPEFYKYYSEPSFTYNGITQGNRNPLLYKGIGADGVKTGHTDVAGYGLIGSTNKDGRRLIMVFNGLSSMQARADESTKLMVWGMQTFGLWPLYKVGDKVTEIAVWQGQVNAVPVTVAEPVSALYETADKSALKITLNYNEPLATPIVKGTEVGSMTVAYKAFPVRTYKLIAAGDVPPMGLVGRFWSNVKLRLFGSE